MWACVHWHRPHGKHTSQVHSLSAGAGVLWATASNARRHGDAQGLSLGPPRVCRYAELMARIRTQLALKRSVKVAMEATRNLGLLRSILPPSVIAQVCAVGGAMSY